MILRAVNDITENDLLALISDGVAEGRSIDYKRELPGNSDGDKKEFLADASSFANTEGGDLVFGMLEPMPTKNIPSDAKSRGTQYKRDPEPGKRKKKK